MNLKKILLSLLIPSVLATSCSSGTDSKTDDVTETSPTEAVLNSEKEPEEASLEIDENALQATLKFDKTYQDIIGFGAGYTWYCERMLKPSIKEEVADLLFSDAKMTILRFKNEYKYSDAEITENSREVQIYELAQSRAAEYGEDVTVLMSCWSPPAYLKSNNKLAGGGTIKKDGSGNYMYKEYGEWWAESVEAYINAGLPIDYMSIQNECDFEVSYDGMELSAFDSDKHATYGTAFLSVYDAMQERLGDNAPLMLGPETMSCVYTTVKQHIMPILEANRGALAGIAHHLYYGGTSTDKNIGSSCEPDTFNMNFWELYAEYGEEFPLWQTEFYRGSPMETAGIIHNSLVNENVSSYIYWGGIWGRNQVINDVIAIDNNGDYYVGSVYWVMRHFSEYIRPGYTRVQVDYAIKPGVKISAFISPENDKLASVLINPTSEEITVQLTGLNAKDSNAYQSVLTDDLYDSGEYYNDIGGLDENNKVVLSPMSVTTLSVDLT